MLLSESIKISWKTSRKKLFSEEEKLDKKWCCWAIVVEIKSGQNYF
jgi:hypothetical protein